MTIIDGKITEFQGDEHWLSNFWPCAVMLDGTAYPSVEHAYQAAKFDQNHGLRARIGELPANHSGAAIAKRLGAGQHPLDWSLRKLDIMEQLVRDKFSSLNPELRAKLLATGDTVLEEGNRWYDTFWGVYPPASGRGQNHLGKIIMKIREEIRQCK